MNEICLLSSSPYMAFDELDEATLSPQKIHNLLANYLCEVLLPEVSKRAQY